MYGNHMIIVVDKELRLGSYTSGIVLNNLGTNAEN